MAAPAPTRSPVLKLQPQLRLAQATARQAWRAAPVIRKVGLAVLVGLLWAAVILAIVAEGRKEIDPDQRWFWEPEWLAGELEADQEIAAGQGTRYESDEAWEASLRARLKSE